MAGPPGAACPVLLTPLPPRAPVNLRPAAALALLLIVPVVAACAGGDAPADDGRPDVYYPGRLDATAPERFQARFETSAGDFVVDVHRSWSPLGADRFYNLVRNGYYDDTRIFRVVPDFMVQFGIAGDPVLEYQWRDATLRDDPVVESNTRGRVTFAMSGRDSRINQIFINYKDNRDLDAQGFSPFGEIVEGMEVVDAFYSEYGDGPPRGDGPYQAQVLAQGNEYLDAEFPELTRILRAVVEGDG